MVKVAPSDDGPDAEAGEVQIGVEDAPPGWKEDPDADAPVLEEAANEDFLAKSRKRRQV